MDQPVHETLAVGGGSLLEEDVRFRDHAYNALAFDNRHARDPVLEHAGGGESQRHVARGCKDLRRHDIADFHHVLLSLVRVWPGL